MEKSAFDTFVDTIIDGDPEAVRKARQEWKPGHFVALEDVPIDSIDVLGRLASRTHAISGFVETRLKPEVESTPPGVGCGISTPATLAALKWHVWKAYRGW